MAVPVVWHLSPLHPRRVLSDVDAFIAFVGADQKGCNPNLEDPCGLNRARVSGLRGWGPPCEVSLENCERSGRLHFQCAPFSLALSSPS